MQLSCEQPIHNKFFATQARGVLWQGIFLFVEASWQCFVAPSQPETVRGARKKQMSLWAYENEASSCSAPLEFKGL